MTATTDTPADERIAQLRGQIDACDAEIIELVQRRLAVSQEIGELRRASGGTRLSLSREQQVLARFQAALASSRTPVPPTARKLAAGPCTGAVPVRHRGGAVPARHPPRGSVGGKSAWRCTSHQSSSTRL